jgi:tetratricopeptide (TPR) repeat protein
MLQDAIRLRLPNADQSARVRHAVQLLAALLDDNAQDEAAGQRWSKLLPHVQVALAHVQTLGLSFKPIAALFTTTATHLHNQQQLVPARDYFEQALAMRQRLYGNHDHPDLAHSLNNLGAILRALGELPAAHDHHQQALAMRQRLYGDKDHPDLVESLGNLAEVLRRVGDRPGAAALEAKAAAMQQRLLNQQYPVPPDPETD